MGGTCSMDGDKKKAHMILVEKREGGQVDGNTQMG
jgi:hypothetical protein